MKRNQHFWKHVKNVQKETKNAAILSDVAGNPPEQQAKQDSDPLTPVEKIASQNSDGKTWGGTQ